MAKNPVLKVLDDFSQHIDFTGRRVALFLQEELTSPPPAGTPRDTGHAVANWILSTDRPFSGIAGSKQSVSTARQNSSRAQIASLTRRRNALGQFVGVPIYLVNNVEYVHLLNLGYSKQSPAGFIERAIAIAQKRAR